MKFFLVLSPFTSTHISKSIMPSFTVTFVLALLAASIIASPMPTKDFETHELIQRSSNPVLQTPDEHAQLSRRRPDIGGYNSFYGSGVVHNLVKPLPIPQPKPPGIVGTAANHYAISTGTGHAQRYSVLNRTQR